MDIKSYYDGISTLHKFKALEEEIIKGEIERLEKDPVVEEYNNCKKDLAYLDYKYSNSNYRKEIADCCEHPIFVYEYDLCTLNNAVPCMRCILCGRFFYDVEDVDLVNLYEQKRLLAKKEPLDDEYYDLGYIDYKPISIEELRKIYYKLSLLSEDNTKFNAEDYMFDHLTGNNPHIKRRTK